jgi:hypothetical protein
MQNIPFRPATNLRAAPVERRTVQHAGGLAHIHRDGKAQNVMRQHGGRIVLMASGPSVSRATAANTAVPHDIQAIAVLPFQNVDPDKRLDYFWKDRLRIITQLSSAETRHQLWSERFDRTANPGRPGLHRRARRSSRTCALGAWRTDGAVTESIRLGGAVCQIHGALGERAIALDRIDTVIEERAPAVAWMGVRPVFDGLRKEARFAAACLRVGVPPNAEGAPR